MPSLSQLPPPPPDKNGWPWTEESPQLSATMPDGAPWPRISIVTPSYNQGQFIEETIRSVLLQGYPNLEYIIVDGGSTDNSVETIKKYEPWLAYWVSEKDRGQSQAINKGFTRATGGILAWINSDDLYEPSAFETSALYLLSHPREAIVYGSCVIVDEVGNKIEFWGAEAFPAILLTHKNFIPQPATFIQKWSLEKVGMLDENLHFALDKDLWMRIGIKFRFGCVSRTLARFRLYPNGKTEAHRDEFHKDHLQSYKKLLRTGSLTVSWRASIHRAIAKRNSMLGQKRIASLGHYLIAACMEPGNPESWSGIIRGFRILIRSFLSDKVARRLGEMFSSLYHPTLNK
jgi:glycosyltransferase involved in cell wall biosynthesis